MPATPAVNIRCNSEKAEVVIRYALKEARHVTMKIVDLGGRRVAEIINSVVPAGPQEAAWDVTGAPAGVYFVRTATNSQEWWTGKVVIGK
jgi:hypothetical protein